MKIETDENSVSQNYAIGRLEYNNIKNYVESCLAKHPHLVKPEFEYPPITIEIDEGSKPPIGSVCWVVFRKTMGSIPINMNQPSGQFKTDFLDAFELTKKMPGAVKV